MVRKKKPHSELPALRVVRANGGFKQHLLPAGSYTSLCGHTPQNNNFLMKRRGMWLHVASDASADCEKCIKGAIKRGYKNYRGDA